MHPQQEEYLMHNNSKIGRNLKQNIYIDVLDNNTKE